VLNTFIVDSALIILNLIKLTVLFNFIPAQIIIEIAKGRLGETLFLWLAIRILRLQNRTSILEN
jgi:hypothetical protein